MTGKDEVSTVTTTEVAEAEEAEQEEVEAENAQSEEDTAEPEDAPRKTSRVKVVASALLRPPRAVWRFGLRRPVGAVTAMVVVVAVLAAGVGWLAWQRGDQQAVEAARTQAVDAAREGVVAALSYDYHSIDSDVAKARGSLTGSFLDDYTKLMNGTVIQVAKSQETVTKAAIADAAVVSAGTDEVQVLLFVNQTTTGKQLSGPKLDGSRVQTTLENIDGKWLISALQPV
ncbi:hypothetical protein FPZ12_016770 [Amycolatopsis acidicola]|uniref:Mce-associated membrane protein n=1 Tax=Amycolatopsis acidicola TaxID=2596893 RepID=A0A5N0V536_9PSEU|nr:hypothetical protein [Amycolatopsis acidicola]KAA9160488.1 hypothetical protein FPZ12_016770 [Amycolatopsis acidicola]